MKTFVLLLTLALLAVSSAASGANSVVQPRIETQPGLDRTEGLSLVAAHHEDADTPDASKDRDDDESPASFGGTWKTLAGGNYPYTVILKQVGDKVSGTYSPRNGKIFDGVVTDNKLTFKWTQDGGYEGAAEFTMDEDGKGFTGSSTAVKPKEFTVTWNTYKPPVSSFAGTWETITNGKNSVPLSMVQKGDQVTGLYPGNNGKIEGAVSGRVLRFKWESDGGTGSGRFVMDESTQAFSGTYNRGDNPDDVDATWNGKRLAVSDDKAPGSGDKAPGSGDKAPGAGDKAPGAGDKAAGAGDKATGDGDKAPENVTPATFAGVWHAQLGEATLELILQQAGNQVTGQVKLNSAEVGVISEGIVVGNILRFKIVRDGKVLRAKLPDKFVGIGELVMDEGGKSFTGNVLGAATSGGALIGR